MPHVRQLIRDNIVTTLTGLTTTGARVYPSRVYPIGEAALPGLSVYTNSENIAYQSMKPPRTLERTLTVTVEAYVKGVSGFDDSIDTIMSEVEAALYTDITRGGNARDTMIESVDIEFSGEGDQPLARATLNVAVNYITTEGTPSVAI